MAQLHRIDVHHHPSPPSDLAARFERDKQYEAQFGWSVAKSLDDMDRGGVATAMLSLPHSVQIWPGKNEEARALARGWNDYMAKLRSDHPGRFGIFAALPILDIEGSLREIEYALDTLKADGVALMTNIGDRWLGDEHYTPIFAELNRRGAIVYTHPVAPDCCRDILPEFNDSVIEYGADTTRAIGKMLYSGAASRNPKARFIFSHAGGTLPYSAFRFLRHYSRVDDQIRSYMPDGLTAALNKFYYDTANTSNRHAMGSFRELISLSQLMFGTDFPFGHADYDAKALAGCGFTDAEVRAIECENAYRLWPRLKPKA
jgi:predicted TIM-barrel fold metal-dependent hydrolase